MFEYIKEQLAILYPGYKVYGPYPRKSDGRNQLVLRKEKHSITKQYAKFILEVKLGRVLSKSDTVDHEDRNKLNDTFENVRLLTLQENSSIAAKRLTKDDVACVWCTSVFTPTNRHLGPHRKSLDPTKLAAGPFCSKVCTGKYGAHVQKTGELLPEKLDTREYYSLQ